MSEFKVGDRVRFSQKAMDANLCPILIKKYGRVRGEVMRIRKERWRGGYLLNIKFNHGAGVHGFHPSFFEIDPEPAPIQPAALETFPFQSHRTLAQVDQTKEPA